MSGIRPLPDLNNLIKNPQPVIKGQVPIRPPPRVKITENNETPDDSNKNSLVVSSFATKPDAPTDGRTVGRPQRLPFISMVKSINPNGGKYLYNLKIARLPEDKLKHVELPAAPSKLPATVDLRSRFPPIYDQGSLGSCTANALCGAFGYCAPGFTGSRLFLYYNERLLENDVAYDAGAYLHDGIRALETYGVCAESVWPYITYKYAVKPPNSCYTAAQSDRVLTAQNIRPVLATMKQALSQGYPFVFGFTVYSSFESSTVTRTGIIPMPGPRDYILGGHAVVAVGYDDAHQWFIFRNSWGIGWGDHGYGYIPYAYLTNTSLVSDLWYITSVKK